ncbi:type II toxin-antitoxin system HicB family antitoxin [Nguyenibacter sp. L1]|uniref:type II toxin-antitoxin system HicB family antitoxin n=1 Tax=Nguyenibacter sp. L1 TaxID=3049350 RepID=UPI002B493486|nr:type II toxin-antitoxin system HicB family antitoxin [Nguyenibacter sp. L1]WRH88675.1 type II toxin-antitoxin system HicB family antitoxin [Nguyenibacter sp. L1]
MFPDLPGCVSAGDTLNEALANAADAAAGWIDATLDAGDAVPSPRTLDMVRRLPEYAGWAVGFVTIDPAMLDDRVERANISLPRGVLKRLDALAKAGHETRSGMIAALTLQANLIPSENPGSARQRLTENQDATHRRSPWPARCAHPAPGRAGPCDAPTD